MALSGFGLLGLGWLRRKRVAGRCVGNDKTRNN
jgi:hypothetical protein